MNKVLPFVFIILLLGVGFAGLTPNKIVYANGTYVYLLDKGTNTTINANVGFEVVSVRSTNDGSNFIIVTTASKAFTYNSNLGLVHTIGYTQTTPHDSCDRFNNLYYCSDRASEFGLSEVRQYDLSGAYTGVHFGSSGSGTPYVSYAAGFGITTDDIIYTQGIISGSYHTILDAYNISNGALLASFDNNPNNIYSPARGFIKYDATSNKIYSFYTTNNTLAIYNLNSNKSIASLNSTYNAVYGLFPKYTSTNSYLTANATGIYEFDGSTLFFYPFAFTNITGIKFDEYTQIGYAVNTNLEVRASGGISNCQATVGAPATCTFVNSNTSQIYNVDVSTNNAVSGQSEIPVIVSSYTKELNMIYNNNKCYYGACKPYDIQWNINHKMGVGGAGLAAIDYTPIYNINNRPGFKIQMKTANGVYDEWLTSDHWFAGIYDATAPAGTAGATSPAIQAGTYMTPLILHLTANGEIDPTTLTVAYDSTLGGLSNQFVYNDFDGTSIWKNNKFYTALAYNSTHYLNVTWTYNTTLQGWVLSATNASWAQMNATLIALGNTNPSIAQALTESDFSTPVTYDTDTNIITLRGWLWGETNPTINVLTPEVFDYPSVPGQNVTAFNCNSPLIKQLGAYDGQNICNLPVGTAREFFIQTPDIDLYPIITVNSTVNNYYSGTATLPTGTYTYSCQNTNTNEIKTGSITFSSVGAQTMPVYFNSIGTQSIGYSIKILNAYNNPVVNQLVTVEQAGSTFNMTQLTNASGYVTAWGILQNTPLIVTIPLANAIIKYEGGNALDIGDSYNTQGYGSSGGTGSCAGFDGLYKYVLTTSPTFKDYAFKVKCGNSLIADADIYLDGSKVATTNSSGVGYFTSYKTYDDIGFNVTIISDYGNFTEKKIKTLANATYKPQNCDESEVIQAGASSDFNLTDIINKFANIYILGFIAVLALAGFVWLKTGSAEITAVALAGGLIIGYFVGFIPLFAVVALIAIVAIIIASRFLS